MSVLLIRVGFLISSKLSSGINQETTEGNISKRKFINHQKTQDAFYGATNLLHHLLLEVQLFCFGTPENTWNFIISQRHGLRYIFLFWRQIGQLPVLLLLNYLTWQYLINTLIVFYFIWICYWEPLSVFYMNKYKRLVTIGSIVQYSTLQLCSVLFIITCFLMWAYTTQN